MREEENHLLSNRNKKRVPIERLPPSSFALSIAALSALLYTAPHRHKDDGRRRTDERTRLLPYFCSGLRGGGGARGTSAII